MMHLFLFFKVSIITYKYNKAIEEGRNYHDEVTEDLDQLYMADQLLRGDVITVDDKNKLNERIRLAKEEVSSIRCQRNAELYNDTIEKLAELEAERKEQYGRSAAVDSYVRLVFNEARGGNPYYIGIAEHPELRNRMRINKLDVSKVDYILSA